MPSVADPIVVGTGSEAGTATAGAGSTHCASQCELHDATPRLTQAVSGRTERHRHHRERHPSFCCAAAGRTVSCFTAVSGLTLLCALFSRLWKNRFALQVLQRLCFTAVGAHPKAKQAVLKAVQALVALLNPFAVVPRCAAAETREM